MLETKQKILDAAIDLIAEQGYVATSIRHIIAKAGVNLAAIHYHFGSKEELLDELISWKVTPINRERLELLEKAKAAAAPKPLSVEAILRAFMLPMAGATAHEPQFVKVMGRIMAEGLLPAVIDRHFMPTARRFIDGVRQVLPELSEEEFQWRIHFMKGAMVHTMCNAADVTTDFDTRIGYLIRFVNAGLCAPAVHQTEVTI
jgi:AcrR family transcriptional regulator